MRRDGSRSASDSVAARTRNHAAHAARWARTLSVSAILVAAASDPVAAQPYPTVPPALRGRFDAERSGVHDAANIRTVFWNFGMVGDYPADPGKVDLSVFHSAEVPKGSGMNYTDGITPFVLAKIVQANGDTSYIMETGYRERQTVSPFFNRVMRFEPRPGYFQADPTINRARSPAMSHDPRTWPATWPNKDHSWDGTWDGYFGKRSAADQESFTVMDDDYYDAWRFYPDARDSSRHGLGLRVEVRGFQWANPQAGNVIFWHYDITNEGTTDYKDNIVFGLYMDSGVGGSALSCDGVYESDDDNAYFDKSFGLNLVYTWDRFGHGADLAGLCSRTGYLGYAYLETPGNAVNGIDDDNDGFVDETRDGGPGIEIVGQDNIRAYWAAHYDTTKSVAFYGPLVLRPAYRYGRWWTGDEDMDWRADLNDLGADGVPDTHDPGEGDGIPTEGEANFDRTDLNESDQIGLTGFKMNRIRAGPGNTDPTTDGILFFTDDQNWPARLFQRFTGPPEDRFDTAVAANYNIAFLFASGPFTLDAGKTERFSLALAYGADLTELRETVQTVQLIYNANYQFAVPPPPPIVTAEPGDGYVRLSWNDVPERAFDPVTSTYDFEGYRIYRSTDPEFRDPRVITTGRGTGPIGNGKPIAQFDLADGKRRYSRKTIDGVAYWLGDDTGIVHTWTDTTVTNGQQYYYAVCAYDYGFDAGPGLDSLTLYPSENSIPVSRTPRGGLILPINAVAARPNPRVAGYVGAAADTASHAAGRGTGTVDVRVVNADIVPDGHLYSVTFTTPHPDSIRATQYTLRDSTKHQAELDTGQDFDGAGIGPVGAGLLPIVTGHPTVTIDSARTVFDRASPRATARIKAQYQYVLSNNERRPGFPDAVRIEFDRVVRDTAIAFPPSPGPLAKFRVFAETPQGDLPLDFFLLDIDGDHTLSRADEAIDIVTYRSGEPTRPKVTWRVQLDTLGQGQRGPIVPPTAGDVYRLRLKTPLSGDDQFVFTTRGSHVDPAATAHGFVEQPYVVPNPYLGAASFEPARFAVSGRGDRRIEFRAIPLNSVIRIYTVRGELVQTLHQDGSTAGYVPWDLRTKDNLEAAPGLYVFHVDAPKVGTRIGKFAIIQ
jgi:hypothetical protein